MATQLPNSLTININTAGGGVTAGGIESSTGEMGKIMAGSGNKAQHSPRKYDTFLEAAMENTFSQIEDLASHQEALQNEQAQLLREHKGLQSKLNRLQKQQEKHIAREVSKMSTSEEKSVVELFSTRKPKNLAAGLSSGAKSIGKGFIYGGKTACALPSKGAKEEGAKGFAKGLVKGLGVGMAIPMGGLVTGVYQMGRGAFESSTAQKQKKSGKKWDAVRREWYWPNSFREQEATLMQLQSSVKKQKLKFMQQTYKLDAQQETLKKLANYLKQQEANIGAFTAFDKEKYKFLQARKKEELQEARELNSVSMSSLDKMQTNSKGSSTSTVNPPRSKSMPSIVAEKAEFQPGLMKSLSEKEKEDLALLELKSQLGKTSAKRVNLTENLNKQIRNHEKQQHWIEQNEEQLLKLKKSVDLQKRNHDSALKEHFTAKNMAANTVQNLDGQDGVRAVEFVMSKAVPIPVTQVMTTIMPATTAVVVHSDDQDCRAKQQACVIHEDEVAKVRVDEATSTKSAEITKETTVKVQ